MNARSVLPLACIAIALISNVGQAQRFRIDTDVFQEGVNSPISQNITLFSGELVYDFIMTKRNKEIAIFDSQQGLFVLLDPNRKVRTTLTKQNIREISGSIRQQGEHRDPAFYTPRFKTNFDQETGWLTLTNQRITYRVRGTTPTNAGPVAQYRQFADWYARLNATKTGTMPPFPRLELNHAIQLHRMIPQEVQLTVEPANSKERKFQVRSKHLVSWELSAADLERIEEANQFWATFDLVQLKDYRRLGKVAARDE